MTPSYIESGLKVMTKMTRYISKVEPAPLGWGLVKYDFPRNMYQIAPIPVNLVLRGIIKLQRAVQPDKTERNLQQARSDGYREGYQFGLSVGMKKGRRQGIDESVAALHKAVNG